jgi:hypothetical protein
VSTPVEVPAWGDDTWHRAVFLLSGLDSERIGPVTSDSERSGPHWAPGRVQGVAT